MSALQITYRKAVATDLITYFNWANDEETRKNSFNSDGFDLETHREWFLNKIGSLNCVMLVFEDKKKIPVGQVRFECEKEHAIIGISIDSAFRGMTLASFMIDSACTEYFRNFTQPIAAHIKATNIASIKAFEKAGFVLKEKYTVEKELRFILLRQHV